MDANNALELNSGLLLSIEVLAVVYGGWAGSAGSGDWGKIPATIPVMIFSLVYHDLAPGKDKFLEIFTWFSSPTIVMFASSRPFIVLQFSVLIWLAILHA